ncbi:hypothetical protein [Acinetobacter indicus]|uniref:hypothetical protein n=1 Tax=Acinetobacter indicus TaxID=756892 RepID=UPI001C08CD01|nr:hypothetical protein [Acinetobacter indicus]
MTMFLAPYTAIADIDGSPLDAGFLFFGEYGKDPELFPVEVFWDADFTVPAAQPIRTRNGYPVRNGSPTKVYLKTAQHSIVIKNRNSAFILVDFYNKGWDASFVVDASGKNQQEINTFLKKRVAKSKADLAGTMIASDGDIVLLASLNLGEYSGGGEFVYDETLANVNDGYMIINGFKRSFGNGFLQLEWFGGKPFTDCTAAYKRAVAYLKANPVRPASYSRGGYFGIQFNAGVYLISENIKFENMAGFTVKGSGVQATTIVYTVNTGTFYDYIGYSNIHFSDMTVQCGTYNQTTGYVDSFETFSATCNDFDGTNGGTKYTEDNIRYVGWNRVYKTTKTTINCDMHSYNRTSYENNNVVWENSNPNAVSWEFNQFYTYGTREAVFLNPCNTTRTSGGDHINPCPFFKLNLVGHGSNCTFDTPRFEFWKDKDGIIGEFKYLDVTTMCQGTVFKNVSTFGVPTNASTLKTGYVSKNFDIKFKECKLYGYWEALGDVYSRAAKSMLTFEDCLTAPMINHIYGTEAIKSPIGVNYIRQNTQEGGAITGTTVNRFYRGVVLGVGSHLSISKEPMIDTFQVREFVNGTFTYTFPVWNVAPFILQLSKIRLAIHKDNATNPLDIKFYSDAAKTQLVATYSMTAPISTSNRIYTIVDVLPSSFINTPIFGSAANIYMELSAPSAAAGTCYVNVEFEYMHVGFST